MIGVSALARFFERFAAESAVQAFSRQAPQAHRQALEWLETALWRLGPDDELLDLLQALYREQEQQLPADLPRHDTLVAIPVADRPRHLEHCLYSLLALCRRYQYGGFRDGRYRRVSVLIADDSADADNIRRHREIAARFTEQGLACEHFGPDEQFALVNELPAHERAALARIIGDAGREGFHHKGASITRNIACLKLRRMQGDGRPRLFHFVDSDQEFCIRAQTPTGERELYAVNYFYWLDRLFRENDIAVLTGKVVGDPPVSPSVMANNFLEDVHGFLSRIADLEPARPCSFHEPLQKTVADAAYHDMADLFGFRSEADAYDYSCRLSGPHDHAACLQAFAGRLNGFFDGEHLTRRTLFEPQAGGPSLTPARTIYTGNYCFNAEGLDFFIPFANLRLRMAGPVLGRLIKAALGERFVSANLPMLHRRTVGDTGQSEFRPGIQWETELVDLSGEFERQFFGDLMLFSMERLTELGYPQGPLNADRVEQVLQEVEGRMLDLYRRKQGQILDKLVLCKSFFSLHWHWWHKGPEAVDIGREFQRFFRNMEFNFGPDAAGYFTILSPTHREERRREMRDAILAYGVDRAAWSKP